MSHRRITYLLWPALAALAIGFAMFAVIRQSRVVDNPPAGRSLLFSTSHRVVQTFVMTADGFDSFTIWFGPAGHASAVLIELSEVRADATRVPLGRFVVPPAATTGRHVVRLSPIARSAGKTFRLELHSLDDRARAPDLVANRDDTYARGTLHVDDQEQWGDLAFSTTAENASLSGRLRRQIRERTTTREAATWLTLYGLIGGVLVLSLAYGIYGGTYPGLHRLRLPTLLLVLSAELLLAGWYRWPITTLPIQTPFDYGTGHVTVTSENWRRHGALRQHFMPRLSTDLRLPEWPFRTPYAQDYYSVPPLAFMLHYGATRLIDHVEPVLLGKLLAQALIAASAIAAAFFLYHAFGVGPPLVGLSFLIWGTPFLLWFANGYFAVNVGLAVQLILVSWCTAIAASTWSHEPSKGWIASVRANVVIGSALAFLGAFADYLPLMANAIAVAGLLAVVTTASRPRGHACRVAVFSSGAICAGTVAAVATTVLLYGRQMGFARYWDALTNRIADRSGGIGRSPFEVIRQQMLTAWPAEVLAALLAMLSLVLGWCVVALVRRRSGADGRHAMVILAALAVSIGPSCAFHYRAVNYVSIHWWFAGTWTIGWVVTLCAFVWVLGRVLRVFGSARMCAVGYQTVWVLLLGAAIAANLRFVELEAWAHETIRAHEVSLYRLLGADLPRDGAPLVVTGMPGLFEDFPYTTAYLRRPVIVRDRSGLLRLPGTDGERADQELLRRGGDLYIAYDPYERQCAGPKIPLSEWHRVVPIEVCRASASQLVLAPDRLLGSRVQPTAEQLAQRLDEAIGADSCDPERTLSTTRSFYRQLYELDGRTVKDVGNQYPEAVERVVEAWRHLIRGAPASSDAEFKSAFLVGPIAHARRWYVLLVNLEGEELPEFHPGQRLLNDSRGLTFVRPYYVRTRDGQGLLPFAVVEVDADSAADAAGGSLELWDFNRLLLQTRQVSPVTLPARGF